jgi:hypothetical protein
MKSKIHSSKKSSKSASEDVSSISVSSDSSSDEDLYEAEEIIGKKTRKGRVFYKVKWKDYPTTDSTWEPMSSFNETSQRLIEKYEKKLKKSEKQSIPSKVSEERKKRFSHRQKVLTKNKSRKTVTEIKLDSDSECEENQAYNKASSGADDSSINSDELSPGSAESDKHSTYIRSPKEIICLDDQENKKKSVNRKRPFKHSSKIGDITQDKVKRIISATIVNPKTVELRCLVEFEKRKDGFIPDPKYYSSEKVRVHAPHSLIDFYQSRISINKKSP